MTNKLEAAAELSKLTPPVAVSGLSVAGVPLNEWVYILTIVWIAWQIGWSIKDRIDKRGGKHGR